MILKREMESNCYFILNTNSLISIDMNNHIIDTGCFKPITLIITSEQRAGRASY